MPNVRDVLRTTTAVLLTRRCWLCCRHLVREARAQ